MKLSGTLNIGDERYVIFANFVKNTDTYISYACVQQKDYIALLTGAKSEKLKVIYTPEELLNVEVPEKYYVGALRKLKGSGRIKSAGDINQLEIMLNTLHFARTYQFSKSNVYLNHREVRLGTELVHFGAEDEKISFLWVKQDGVYSELKIKYGTIMVDLKSCQKIPNIKEIEFKDATMREQNAISKATIEAVDYNMLSSVLDMSWYREEDRLKKKYYSVKTIEEFEIFYGKMIEACRQCPGPFFVALDTETTGTNIYLLRDDNPVKDHCVAISVSWEFHTSWVIFTDMEYFNSIPNDYAFQRLEEVFSCFQGTRTINYVMEGVRCSYCFTRDKINLIGHNISFDRRAAWGEGHDIWFDDDTLQMAFVINPTIVRGNNKLKVLTRKIFGHETPELSDVLGKGNEDKYRYLSDEEVATIYAGADADYTLGIFGFLRKLLGEVMYHRYRRQDVKMLNILAISEYNGLNTEVEGTKQLADASYENIKILEQAAYKYVGAYMDFYQQMSILQSQFESGILTEEEYQEAIKQVHPDSQAVYEFEFKGADLREVMYGILKYPVLAKTDTGLAKVDKKARKKLLREKRKENSTARKLTRSILATGCNYEEYERLHRGNEQEQAKAKDMVLVDAEEFNKKEYPFALLLEKHAVCIKEYTSYYKPIREENLDGRLFKSYSLARIETRRIMNPLQTIKKELKKLIIPHTKEHYLLDFDMSQVEYRIMASLAGAKGLVQRMADPEKDYHTETGSMVEGIPAYKVTKEQRKSAKTVSFGQPYGLGEYSLTETIEGEITDEGLFRTRMKVHKWRNANWQIVEFLEKVRDGALDEVTLSQNLRDFMDAWQRDPKTKEYLLDEHGKKIPKPMGAVYNKMGFCRYFDLTGIDQSSQAKERRASGKYTAKESTIRRAAGNYPIQSFAAELFRIILYRFYDECVKEGIGDKVVWHMLIHDELLCSVHKSVNPFLIYKIVKKACMITISGHTNYFVGINIGNTWKECKDDEKEAPVYFVEQMVERFERGELPEHTWFDNPWEIIKPLREEYVKERIHEVLLQIQPDLDDAPIDLPLIFEKFDNYTVRAYVNDYAKNHSIPSGLAGDEKDDAEYVSRFESWVLNVFGEGKELIGLDGTLYKVKKGSAIEEDFVDFFGEDEGDILLFEDDYYDYEKGTVINTYYMEREEEWTSDLDNVSFDYSKYDECKDVAQMTMVESKYQNLKVLNGCLVISVDNTVQSNFLKGFIATGNGSGFKIMFKVGKESPIRWKRAADTLDLSELDDKVSVLRGVPSVCNVLLNRLIIPVKSAECYQRIQDIVLSNKGRGYHVFVKNSIGGLVFVGQMRADADFYLLNKALGG